MRTSLLFVDDEPNVLSGLQRMLRGQRDEWEMQFVAGAQEALDLMSRQSFDVVISDMRMPGMNGAEFLAEVMRLYPATVRIVLSGHADKDLVSQCVGVAHQFISKPCQADELKTLIANASSLTDALVDTQVKRVLGGIDRLPTRPSLYLELREALKDPDISGESLGDIIASDIGMTVKVLKVVNSSFFGLRRHIETPHEAINFLGLDTLQSLVLANGIFESSPPVRTRVMTVERLWQHTLQVAQGARRLAQLEGLNRDACNEAYVGGILHDVGILVLIMNFPEAYDRITDMVATEHLSIPIGEKWEFGVTHSEVGAYLLGLWGIPAPLLQIVSLHHTPEKVPQSPFTSLLAVHVADALQDGAVRGADFMSHSTFLHQQPPERLQRWMETLGVPPPPEAP